MDCEICGQKIPEVRARRRAKTCSEDCARARERRRFAGKHDRISKAARAAISRSLVTADLLERGHGVLESVSGDGLYALKDGKTLRVSVHTGYRRESGLIQWPKPAVMDESAVYAVVISGSGEILYFPEKF